MRSSFIPVSGAIPGPAGVDGAPGVDGVDGRTVLYGSSDPTTEGVDGDFYINTTTHYIFGPKASGVWPSGTALIGPQGDPGADGADGTDGTYRDVTISTESPTGTPTTGALWFKVEA